MRVLIHGMETTESINNVLASTRIRSDRKIDALHDYFVKGFNLATAAALNKLDADKFGELVKSFHQKAHKLAIQQENKSRG